MIALRPGCVIVGKYRLEHELACGGMGSLWVAVDRKLRRKVVVKFINSVAAKHDDSAIRFEHEARAMAHIRSPHVVQTHDYGVDRGQAYLVMELLEGEDLGVRLARERRLSITAVSKLLSQIARGLDAVHAAGIVHRDLKPANVFLAQVAGEETVKLIDFGVARSGADAERTTDHGVLLGTLKYMAPEQALCEEHLDHRADLWSLAVIVYCLLTGKGPFSGASRDEMVLSICRDPVMPPSRRVADLPPAIDAFFDRAFERKPEARFHSAGHMASAFAAAIKDARTGTLPWGMRAVRGRLPSLSSTVAEGAMTAEATHAAGPAASSPESPPSTELPEDGLPIPSAILPSTYTPRRRSLNESPWAHRVVPKKSWWWASIPLGLAIVCAVVLGIAGAAGRATPSSAASATSALEAAPPLVQSH